METTTVAVEPQRICLDDIDIEPQPRITFRQKPMEELIASVTQFDVIQSITVRPNGKRYRLVAGERRVRAARAVAELFPERKTIPATIRKMDDAEALEVQIAENLHREDVHPMEHAVAFKQLVELRHWPLEEIGKRIGKTVYFVRQCLQLNSLTESWQALFLKDGILLHTALQISQLPPDAQTDLYKTQVSKEEAAQVTHQIVQINSYTINKYKSNLSNACFDLTDPNLDAKAGACSTCPFNSGHASLFPEDETNIRCNNAPCFNHKTDLHLQAELPKAMEDPLTLLVYEDNKVPEIVANLRKEGAEVLKRGWGADCRTISTPEIVEWTSFYRRNREQKIPVKKIKPLFKVAQDNYEVQKKAFDKAVETGKYKKALLVHSDNDRDTGKYIYVALSEKQTKPTAKKAQAAIENGHAAPEDIGNEIQRIIDREKRSKELDQEKVQRQIVEAVKKDPAILHVPKTPNRSDTLLTNFLLMEALGYNSREKLKKIIKVAGLWEQQNPVKYFEALQRISKQQLTIVIREIVIDKFQINLANTKAGLAFRKMAESLGTIPIQQFEKDQAAKALKRNRVIDDRVKKLKGLKADMEKEQKARTIGKKKKLALTA